MFASAAPRAPGRRLQRLPVAAASKIVLWRSIAPDPLWRDAKEAPVPLFDDGERHGPIADLGGYLVRPANRLADTLEVVLLRSRPPPTRVAATYHFSDRDLGSVGFGRKRKWYSAVSAPLARNYKFQERIGAIVARLDDAVALPCFCIVATRATLIFGA